MFTLTLMRSTMKLIDEIRLFLDAASIFLVSDNLKDTHSIIRRYIDKQNKPMQIAIIGKIKASKSTLVNAILETDNVVQTGAMEMTYNVSWLKYGVAHNSVTVYYKDGHTEVISKDKWCYWANADSNRDKIRDEISYMEIPFDNHILKDINIIDTPGLLSGGIDAQNTIDFLSKSDHKPDAIVVLFSGALNEEVASVIKEFQNGDKGVSLTPINTLGVLSKIDKQWKPCDPKITLSYPLERATKICNRVINDSNTNHLFYNIYPLNSLLSIASFSISDKDIELLKLFNATKVESKLINIDRFISQYTNEELEYYPCKCYNKGYCLKEETISPCRVDIKQPIDFDIDPDCIRRYLFMKFDRFGIVSICKFLEQNPKASLGDIKQYLREQSGFDTFIKVLKNHFGERASLIKMQSSIGTLLYDLKNESDNLSAKGKIDASNIVSQIHTTVKNKLRESSEFKLFEILIELYDGKLSKLSSKLYNTYYEQADLENDIKCLAGENGESFYSKLGITGEISIERLKDSCSDKIKKWRAISVEYNQNAHQYYRLSKDMYEAYGNLKVQIEQVTEKMAEYNKFLNINVL